MNSFDLTILRFLTSFSNISPGFDRFMNAITNIELVKGGLVMALFWAAWFGRGSDERRREVLLATLFAAGVALFIAMSLALLLPFRVRPLLAYQTEGMIVPPSWREWSAFPSDHATLFFALAFGLTRAAPALGGVAFIHALLVVCFPRVYIGLHYPTDILGGAAIGMAAAYVFTSPTLRPRLCAPPLALMKRRPGTFYALVFVLTYLIATLFDDLRRSGTALYGYLTH